MKPIRFTFIFSFIFSVFCLNALGQSDRELRDAIRAKDVAKVQAALAAGSRLDTYFSTGEGTNYSPLTFAISFSSPEVVDHLLKAGAYKNPMVRTYKGYTLLQHSLFSVKSLPMSELLIRHGFSLDEISTQGLSAMQIAIGNKRNDLLEWIIGKGADVNVQGSLDNTPLHAAVSSLNVGALRLLLKKGAKLDIANASLHTPLGTAMVQELTWKREVEEGKLSRAEYEVKVSQNSLFIDTLRKIGAPVKLDAARLSARSAISQMQSAILLSDTLGFDRLLSGGYPLEQKNALGQTALAFALDRDKVFFADRLIKAGADVNTLDKMGNDVLMHAITFNKFSAPALLVLNPKFLRYRSSSGALPYNAEHQDFLDIILVVQGQSNARSVWGNILSKMRSGSPAVEYVNDMVEGEGVPYDAVLYSKWHEFFMDVQGMYAAVPARQLTRLVLEADAAGNSRFLDKLLSGRGGMASEIFLSAIGQGKTGLARAVALKFPKQIDVNAKTMSNTGSRDKISPYEYYAQRYNLPEKTDPAAVLLLLIELGDTSHLRKIRQNYKADSADARRIAFLEDARSMGIDDLRKKYLSAPASSGLAN